MGSLEEIIESGSLHNTKDCETVIKKLNHKRRFILKAMRSEHVKINSPYFNSLYNELQVFNVWRKLFKELKNSL